MPLFECVTGSEYLGLHGFEVTFELGSHRRPRGAAFERITNDLLCMVVLATLNHNVDVVPTRVHVKKLLAQDVTSFSFLDTDGVVVRFVEVSIGVCALVLYFHCEFHVGNRARILPIPLHEVFPLVNPGSCD